MSGLRANSGDTNFAKVAATTSIAAGDVALAVHDPSLPTLGPQTAAGSVSVVPIGGATPTKSNVTGASADTVLLAASTTRLGATIFNDSTATLYLSLGTGASLTSYTCKVGPGDYFEVPAFAARCAINGYWDAVNGAARVTAVGA